MSQTGLADVPLGGKGTYGTHSPGRPHALFCHYLDYDPPLRHYSTTRAFALPAASSIRRAFPQRSNSPLPPFLSSTSSQSPSSFYPTPWRKGTLSGLPTSASQPAHVTSRLSTSTDTCSHYRTQECIRACRLASFPLSSVRI